MTDLINFLKIIAYFSFNLVGFVVGNLNLRNVLFFSFFSEKVCFKATPKLEDFSKGDIFLEFSNSFSP